MVLKFLSKNLLNPSFQKDKVLYTKAKTLLVLLIFFLITLIGYSLFFIYNGVIFNTKAGLNYFGIFAIILCLLLLKKSANIKYPLRIINYIGFCLITGGVYLSGGFASNDILWYSVIAVSSLLFIGKSDGVIMTILSLIVIVGFYIIDIFQLIEMSADPVTSSLHYRFVNAIIIVLILSFLVLIVVRRNERLDHIIQDIQASQIRESISQDFHDELGNKLASVVHLSKRLKKIKNEDDRITILGDIENESQQVYDNFRDFIWTNDPNSVIVGSLYMYLTDFNQNFFAHKNIQVDGQLIQDEKAKNQKVTSKTIRHLVPLFKEIMTNIYKHSQATQVDWSLTHTKDKLILTVNDNGVGFDIDKVPVGQGLKSIKKRTISLLADYNIKSTPTIGTQVSITIELNNNKKPND